MTPAARHTAINVDVTDHARLRARQRFPGFKAAHIVDEVREALAAGRVSTQKPTGLHPPDDPEALYVWTPDGGRVYALHCGLNSFFVMTTMRPEPR